MRYAALTLLLLVAVPIAAHAERNTGYFERHSGGAAIAPKREGYFFYMDRAPDPTRERLEPEKSEKLTSAEFAGIIPWDEVYTMHPDEFQALISNTVKWAIQDPQPERLKTYQALQAVAADRSQRFAYAWQSVLRDNPVLDPTARRSPTAVGTKLATLEKAKDISTYIGEMRQNMGLFWFTRPGCSFCAQQRQIIDSFREYWGWENVREYDITVFPEVAETFGVSIVPDMFVIGHIGGEILRQRLRAGLTTRSQIEEGMLNAYSQWFLGRQNYVPQPIADEMAGLEAFISKLAAENREKAGEGHGDEKADGPK